MRIVTVCGAACTRLEESDVASVEERVIELVCENLAGIETAVAVGVFQEKDAA